LLLASFLIFRLQISALNEAVRATSKSAYPEANLFVKCWVDSSGNVTQRLLI